MALDFNKDEIECLAKEGLKGMETLTSKQKALYVHLNRKYKKEYMELYRYQRGLVDGRWFVSHGYFD